MSEVAQGALIGISGTIVGALITGIISFIIAKQQINASQDVLNQELKHKIEESLCENRIKAREKVLIPLREAIGTSFALSDDYLTLLIQMVEANKKPDKEELTETTKRWEELGEKLNLVDSDLNKLRYQINDPQLNQLIDEAKISKEQENINIIELKYRAYNPESWEMNTMQGITDELRTVNKRVFENILPVNRRIEELLSGVSTKV